MGATYQPGVAPVAQPQGSPTRNSTLKACHIANTKDGFHRKATENSQLSIGDRLLGVDIMDKPLFPVCSVEPSAPVFRLCCGLVAHSVT
ncbi:MAG: hypothetical protein ACOX9E_14760, partial [Lentisphaeria bacterium]|jgi:hypothetical protein